MCPPTGSSDGQRPGHVTARPGFSAIAVKFIGGGLITCGVLSIILAIAAIIVGVSSRTFVLGWGIWCGVMCITAGAFAVAASKKKSSCLIITCMVLAIVTASFFLFIMFIMTASDIARKAHMKCWHPCYEKSMVEFDSEGRHNITFSNVHTRCYYKCKNVPGITVDAIQLVIALAELIFNIWLSAVCCKAICNCCKPYDPNQVRTVAVYHAPDQSLDPLASSGPHQLVLGETNTGQKVYVLGTDPSSLPEGQSKGPIQVQILNTGQA